MPEEIEIEITLPENHSTCWMCALTALTDTHITISAQGHNDQSDGSDFSGRWDFHIDPQAENETDAQFATRFTKQLLLSTIRMTNAATDQQRYNSEVAAIEPANGVIPDDYIL